MVEFDIILGMHWLFKCFTTIDYRNSVVRFQFRNELELELKGCDSNPITQKISNIKANKMLSKGLGVDKDLSYEEVVVKILDRHVKRLRNK